MRIKNKTDHQREIAVIFYQILPTRTRGKFNNYGDQSGEFVCGCWGLIYRVETLKRHTWQ